MTQRHVLERSADVFALRHGKICPQQQCGNNPRLHGFAVNLVLNQLRQHPGALRMSDQHHPAAVVVVFEVIAPRIEHVVVDEDSIGRHGIARQQSSQRRQRDLPVKRREGTALRREPRKLRADYAFFFRPGNHVAVPRRVVRDRRVHVEAVNRRLRIRGPRLARHLAVCRDDRCRQVNRAGILPLGPAEPVVAVAVIVLGRSRCPRGLGLLLRRCRRRLRANQLCNCERAK